MKKPVEIPAEKIVMEHDAYKVENLKEATKSLLPYFQDLIESFNLQETGVPVTMEVIKELLYGRGPEEFVREALAGTEPVKVGPVTLSREKVKSMLDTPNLPQLVNVIKTFKSAMLTFKQRQHAGIELFEIKKGAAVISETALQQVIDRHTIFAETDAEKEAWLVVQEIKERMEYLREKHKVTLFDDLNPARGVMRQLSEGMPLRPVVRVNAYLLKQQVKGKYRNN